ncbi:SPASM domain-containing protein [Methylomonas albis]|uniref:SPASM domain-containing protein n=1 Tax=Methylomonas albis TaxID=1854563 RepID=A0ABR9CW28_9GAMM|nr:radical SAM protein [Methylomonas albis]MBD9355062.1 SPASM domain-containing protein [Methylomonas albis]
MTQPQKFSDLLDRHCVHPWADVWINTAGDVTCCTQNRTRFGNIHEQPIEEMWNSDAAQSVRKLIGENKYMAAGCAPECPFLRGAKTEGQMPPPPKEQINLDFDVPEPGTALAKNVATVVDDYQLKRLRVSGLPIYVDTQPILRCNSDCFMCNQEHLSTMEHADPILEKIETLKDTAKVFRWQGGEVFSSKRFFNYLENFDSYCNPDLIKYVITNGSLLTKERLIALTNVENPVYFLVSIDGVTKQTYEKIRVGLSYERVIECLFNLAEIQAKSPSNRILVCWNYVVMNSTLDEMREAIDLAAHLNIDLNFAALQGEFPDENIFRYSLYTPELLIHRFAELQEYSKTKSIAVSGFDGMIYRIKQRQDYLAANQMQSCN